MASPSGPTVAFCSCIWRTYGRLARSNLGPGVLLWIGQDLPGLLHQLVGARASVPTARRWPSSLWSRGAATALKPVAIFFFLNTGNGVTHQPHAFVQSETASSQRRTPIIRQSCSHGQAVASDRFVFGGAVLLLSARSIGRTPSQMLASVLFWLADRLRRAAR